MAKVSMRFHAFPSWHQPDNEKKKKKEKKKAGGEVAYCMSLVLDMTLRIAQHLAQPWFNCIGE